MAAEGAALAESVESGGDARRVLFARLVLDHKLAARDPMAFEESAGEAAASALLLDEEIVSPERIGAA
jgi:hypothetical protein